MIQHKNFYNTWIKWYDMILTKSKLQCFIMKPLQLNLKNDNKGDILTYLLEVDSYLHNNNKVTPEIETPFKIQLI